MSQVSFQGPDGPTKNGENGEPELLTKRLDLLDVITLGLPNQLHAIVAVLPQSLKSYSQGFITIDPVAYRILHPTCLLSYPRP
jgi:hypothetical protein